MSLLSLEHVSLGYDNHVIIKDLSFHVDEGDYLCIVGENGSGKTTLMRTILNLNKPIAGDIVYGDGLSASEIGYLPQQSAAQKDFPASVHEIVLSGCLSSLGLHPFFSAKERRLANTSMRRMGIRNLKYRCFRELSGGQQQRVLLARALCATKKILLMDEPVTGLDPKVSTEMYELINQLNQDGITIIMISHDISSIQYASHILYLGEEIFFGTKAAFSASSAGRHLFSEKEDDQYAG